MTGKRGSRRHSTTIGGVNVVVTGTSYQMLEVLRSGERVTSFNHDNSDNFSGEKSRMKNSGVTIFLRYAKKTLNQIS